MALIRDFEMPDSGLVVTNAYHVISEVQVIKRIIPMPSGGNNSWSHDPLRGGVGYIGMIYVNVYSSKQARDDKKKPVAFMSDAVPEKPCSLKFVFDINSADSSVTQAYKYLKTTDYYSLATED